MLSELVVSFHTVVIHIHIVIALFWSSRVKARSCFPHFEVFTALPILCVHDLCFYYYCNMLGDHINLGSIVYGVLGL